MACPEPVEGAMRAIWIVWLYSLLKNARFVSGRRFSGAASAPESVCLQALAAASGQENEFSSKLFSPGGSHSHGEWSFFRKLFSRAASAAPRLELELRYVLSVANSAAHQGGDLPKVIY